MRLSKILPLVIFLSVRPLLPAAAEDLSPREKIIYAISPMGVAEYNDFGNVAFEGGTANFVTFRTQVIGFDDTEKIYSNPQTYLPLEVDRDIRYLIGGEYIVEKYDPEKFTLRIIKFKDGQKTQELPFSADGPIHNAILLPFSLRKVPDLGVGWKTEIRLPNKFEVHLVGIEDVAVPLGRFSAFHFVSFPPQFEIWISNDGLRLPLKIRDTSGLGYTLLIKEHKIT